MYYPNHLIKCIFSFALLIGQNCQAQAIDQDQVFFAGSSFISDAADIERRFPLISKVMKTASAGSSLNVLDKNLRTLVMSAHPKFFAIANKDGNSQPDYKKDSGKALSFAFSHENVEIQQFENKFLAIYDISAQALFFDFSPEKKHLLASYPVRIRFTNLTQNRPDFKEQFEIIKELILNPTQESSLVRQWLKRIEQASLKVSDRLVKVEKAEFDPKALALVPGQVDQAHFSVEVAQLLEATISEEWGVPMVPVTEGQAIKGKMVQVFSNGDAAEFELPAPSFFVRTLIRDYRKISEPLPNGAGDRVAYGVFITTSVNGQAGPVAELKVKNVESITQPAIIKIRLDDWSQFKTVLSTLLIKTVKQVLAKDRSWIAENSTTADAKAQLDSIKTRILRM